MTEQELYNAIDKELFKTGSSKLNVWQFVKFEKAGKTIVLEAMLPSRGNIKVRKPIKKQRVNCDNQEIWLYNLMRFTKKKTLVDEGFLEDIRLDQQGILV